MAKGSRNKNKGHNHQIPNNNQQNSGQVHVPPLFQKAIGDEILNKEQAVQLEKEGKLKEELSKIVADYYEKTQVLKKLEKDYQDKSANIESKIERVDEQKKELEKKEIDSRKSLEQYDNEKSQLQLDKTQLQQDKSDYFKDLEQLRQEQIEIEKEKIKAKAGFQEEKAKVLNEQRQELRTIFDEGEKKKAMQVASIENREDKVEEREIAIIERENELVSKHHNILTELKTAWDIEKEKEQQEIALKLKQLGQDKLVLENAKIGVRQQEENLLAKEAQIEDRISNNYQLQIQCLVQDNQNLKQSYKKSLDEVKSLNEKLFRFADLDRELAHRSIESVQAKIEQLEIDNKNLKRQLFERREEGLEEENDRLEAKVTELDEELYELRAAHEKSLAELYANRLSSQEKYQLTKEKQVLTAYNQSLDINIEHLSKQLDELKGNDKDQLAFKALNEMDEKHRSEAINLQPVPELCHFTEIMQANIARQAFFYSLEDIRLFIAGLAMSKLHLLQGISGTGKTSLARTFARAINNVYDKEKEALYCEIVRVQAGWRDKEDLIGYYNEFEKKFNTKEALQAIYRAQQPEFKDTVQIILLDEMNLSQPEQYFADFLSLLETPDRAVINLLDYGSDTNPKLFVDKRAIEIPDNIWFIGTANHDETTKEFADKTYDRAHVMEVKRSKEKCSTDLASNEQFSFTSLINAFQKAESKDKRSIEKIFEKLKSSELEESLNSVGVSWGNRLEKQAKSFIPVYMACGGKESEALDHLLATKVFRRGKLTGRYDISAEQMQDIKDYLDEMWIELGYGDDDSPHYSHQILDQDIQRLGDL